MADGTMDDESAWKLALGKRPKRGWKGDERSILIALRHAPALAQGLAYDVRSGKAFAWGAGPWGEVGTPIGDRQITLLCAWLQEQGINATASIVRACVDLMAHDYEVDEVREFLIQARSVWDKLPRLSTWLAAYLGAENTPQNSMIGQMFLIGMVARALNPGCQMDYALCLEGAQGIGKSRAIRILSRGFCETLPDFHSRLAQQIACRAWVCEASELAGLRRSTLEHVKAFITRTEESVDKKYAIEPVIMKRSSVIIMTTNILDEGYLQDETGNRRIWPVRCGEFEPIKIADLEFAIEQLFGEATELYHRGVHWWPEGDDIKLLQDIQRERLEEDAWQPKIAEWLRNCTVTAIGIADIAIGALNLQYKDIDERQRKRLAKIMKNLGYKSSLLREGPSVRRIYQLRD